MALLFAVFAATAWLLFLRMKWLPGVDFDIIGFFWVIRNVGRLCLLVLAVSCSAAALSFWIRAFGAPR